MSSFSKATSLTASVGVTVALLSCYFLYMMYKIVLVWKKWNQALIRWKNTLITSVLFLLTTMGLTYSSVDWRDSLFVSSPKICTVLVACNAYVNLLMWLYLAVEPTEIEDDNQELEPVRQLSGVGTLNDSTFVSYGVHEISRQDSRVSDFSMQSRMIGSNQGQNIIPDNMSEIPPIQSKQLIVGKK